MVFIQDIVRGTELTIASGGPPGGLPAATADPRQTPSPAARLAQARQKMDAPFWPAAHSTSLLRPGCDPLDSFVRNSAPQARKVHLSFAALARGAPQAMGSAEDRQ